MRTIDNQDDFLEALRNNPAWREAVRAQILGDELLQLPVRFDAFVREQSVRAANLEERMGRVENDMGALKGDFARNRTIQDAQGIATDMGLEFVRTFSATDLREMAGTPLPRDAGRSFQERRPGDPSHGRDRHQLHSDGGLLHGGPEGLRPGHPERRAHHPVHREAGAGRHSQRQERPGSSGGGGVRGVYWHPLEDRTPSPE